MKKIKKSELKKLQAKIDRKVKESYTMYKKTLSYMYADAPIAVLCLPKPIETILTKNGYLRIYDLFGLDFTKIKGLGDRRIGDLTARLDEFFAML